MSEGVNSVREKISTVTVGGSTFEVEDRVTIYRPSSATCAEIYRRFREWPDYSISHERCDDETCEICNRVFDDKDYRRIVNDGG